MDVKNLMPISTEQIMGFDPISGDLVFILDELQNAEISQNQDVQDVTGKMGRRIGSVKKNKTAAISATNGLVSGGLMEVQIGSEFEDGTHAITWTDTLAVNSNAAALNYIAVGTAGSEILSLRIRNNDGSLGKKFEQAAEVAEGKFTYTASGKALAFNEGDIEDGSEVVVVYQRKVASSRISDESDTYSGKLHLVVDQLAEDKCANVYRVQYDFPLADVSGEFSIAVGDSQTVHNFQANALAGGCSQGNQFFTYTVFGADEADAT